MTDNEIVKALEYCAYRDGCENCPITRECDGYMHILDAIDLINRQKAEIERLETELPENKFGNLVRVKNGLICTNTLDDYDRLIDDISSEAIKGFAERLKGNIRMNCFCEKYVFEKDIDNLVKEMERERE